MKKSLLNKIEKFLENRVKIEPRNERADADEKDVEALYDIVDALAREKWQPSYDAWIPVEIFLNNRSTHDPFNFRPMPDDDMGDSKTVTFEDRMQVAQFNVAIASDALQMVWRCQESKLAVEKAIKEGRYCKHHGAFHRGGSCERCEDMLKWREKNK